MFDFNSLLTPGAIIAAAGLFSSALKSPAVKAVLLQLTAKGVAEEKVLLSEALHNNNSFVRVLVGAAMAYAEQHESEVLVQFKSKADYVVNAVTSDPRFAALGVPAATLAHIVEDIFESFYKGLDDEAHSAK